jgi:hypothetical protein
MKFSRADSRVKVGFSYVSGTNSVPIFRVCWWFGRTSTEYRVIPCAVYISVRPGAGWNETLQASRHISEIKLKFPWNRKAHNISGSLKFLYRNKTILLPTRMPNWISKHRVLAISFDIVTSGRTRVKARGLKDRNPFTRRLVWQVLLTFGYILSHYK